MHVFSKVLHWLVLFFSGWQPKDYMTTIIALAALIISLRRERKDRPAIGIQFYYQKTSTSFKEVYVISAVVEATNIGAQPMTIKWAAVQLWDSENKLFFNIESDERFTLQRAESATYNMEVGTRIIGTEKYSGRDLSVFNVFTTAAVVMDSTNRKWNIRKRDLAPGNRFTSKGYPDFELKKLGLGKWQELWLLIRLHFFALRQYAWGVIRPISQDWR
jgi:hypothetical protein